MRVHTLFSSAWRRTQVIVTLRFEGLEGVGSKGMPPPDSRCTNLPSCIQRTKTVEASRNTWCGSLCPQRRVWLWTLTRLVSHCRKLGLHPAMPNELTELAPGYQPTRKGCRSQMLLYNQNNIYISVGLKLYWPDAVSFS